MFLSFPCLFPSLLVFSFQILSSIANRSCPSSSLSFFPPYFYSLFISFPPLTDHVPFLPLPYLFPSLPSCSFSLQLLSSNTNRSHSSFPYLTFFLHYLHAPSPFNFFPQILIDPIPPFTSLPFSFLLTCSFQFLFPLLTDYAPHSVPFSLLNYSLFKSYPPLLTDLVLLPSLSLLFSPP